MSTERFAGHPAAWANGLSPDVIAQWVGQVDAACAATIDRRPRWLNHKGLVDYPAVYGSEQS